MTCLGNHIALCDCTTPAAVVQLVPLQPDGAGGCADPRVGAPTGQLKTKPQSMTDIVDGRLSILDFATKVQDCQQVCLPADLECQWLVVDCSEQLHAALAAIHCEVRRWQLLLMKMMMVMVTRIDCRQTHHHLLLNHARMCMCTLCARLESVRRHLVFLSVRCVRDRI